MQFRELVGLLLRRSKPTPATNMGATNDGAGGGAAPAVNDAPAGGVLNNKSPEEHQTKEPEKKEGDDATPSGSDPAKPAPKEPEVKVTELEPQTKGVEKVEKAEGDEISPVST